MKYQTVQHLRGSMLRSGYRQVVPQKTVRPLRRTSSNKEVPQRHRMGLPRLSIVCSKLLRFLHYNRFHVADSRGNNIGIIDRNTNSRRNKMPVIYDRLTFRLSLVEGRFFDRRIFGGRCPRFIKDHIVTLFAMSMVSADLNL